MRQLIQHRAKVLRTLCLVVFMAAGVVLPTVQATPRVPKGHHSKHVLLLSVDGLHGIDLLKWVEAHPGSALAELSEHAKVYQNASCLKPSDSFPGLMALITGGTPNSTGIWYDAAYDRSYIAPGLPPGSALGSPLDSTEDLDEEKGTILTTNTFIDPTQLPTDPARGGAPVYPWNLLKVNTIFEVAKGHGLRTAWCDKHTAAYQIVQGPSGHGVDDYFSPEITNTVIPPGFDFTTSHIQIKVYDEIKVDAVQNQALGFDHTGKVKVGAPAIFGMNFQAVSVGQKLKVDPVDPTLTGGYLDADATPGVALEAALKFVDKAIGDIVASLKKGGIYDETTIIVTSKHGQSPIDINQRITADDSFYGDAMNSVLPGLASTSQLTTDTLALIWLDPKHQDLTEKVVAAIRASSSLNFKGGLPLIQSILWGDSLKRLYNDPTKDPRTPDIIVITTPGVIYTGGSKRAEHGGFSQEDTSVALLISRPGMEHRTYKTNVFTTQVAPTILKILDLDPDALQAVQKEHTDELPGFDRED